MSISKRIRKKLLKILHSGLISDDLRSDKNYIIDLVDKGFESRLSDINDSSIFKRIITSYNKAKAVQRESSEIYQVSNEWLPIYENYMGNTINALTTCNTEKLKIIYNNFMRESCSIGLHGLPIDMFKHYFSGGISDKYKKAYLDDVLYRYKLWNSMMGSSFAVKDLDCPSIGNPYGYYIDGTFVKAGSDYLHYYATIIGRLIRSNIHKTVVELGGGYGGMAYYLIRDNSDFTYIDFDLPENLALTSFYLLSAFPNKKIALYGEIDLVHDNTHEYDIILMPNFELQNVNDDCIDLIFNSYSLAEMSRETIDNYMFHFNRIASKFIFHVNHNRCSVVKADEFKIDIDKFELLYRAPALWNMARNPDMDEFEYLYKNKSHNYSLPQAREVN
jgi:hypothetical protein